MDALLYSRYRRGGGTSGFTDWEFSSGLSGWKDAPAPAQVGKRLAEGFLQRELAPDRAQLTNNITHWAQGTFWGAIYGIVTGSLRRPALSHGIPFGLLVWASGYVVLPPSGIYKPIWEYDAQTLWKDASAHLAYGIGSATAFRILAGRR